LDAFFFRVVAMANPTGTATRNYVGQILQWFDFITIFIFILLYL
jgi:hypothetical protein